MYICFTNRYKYSLRQLHRNSAKIGSVTHVKPFERAKVGMDPSFHARLRTSDGSLFSSPVLTAPVRQFTSDVAGGGFERNGVGTECANGYG